MPKYAWHICHHCHGVGCEVCEDAGGWFETPDEMRERQEREGFPQPAFGPARRAAKSDSLT